MKVLKPGRLSVLTRPFEVQRKFRLGISILAYFDISTGALLEEVELWKLAAKELGKDAAIDAGIPKSNAEYLVHGSVFVPDGSDVIRPGNTVIVFTTPQVRPAVERLFRKPLFG